VVPKPPLLAVGGKVTQYEDYYFGACHVGLVTGTCLAEVVNHVMCMDVDEQKIIRLNKGGTPYF